MRSSVGRVKIWLLAAVALALVGHAPTQGQALLQDLSPQIRSKTPSLSWIEPFRDGVLFSSNSTMEGFELYFSSGSDAPARLVQDLLPGSESSSPVFLGLRDGEAVFYINDGVGIFPFLPVDGTVQLGITDGTAEGTRLIPRFSYWDADYAQRSEWVGDELFMVAPPGIWASDLTPVGTRPIPGFQFPSNGQAPRELTPVGDRLFFSARETGGDTELWVVESGLARRLVALDQNPGVSRLTAVGDRLFFVGCDFLNGCEPWVSDGTVAGTRRVLDLRPGPQASVSSSFLGDPLGVPVGDRLIFLANDGTGVMSWATDGTVEGTFLVAPRSVIDRGAQVVLEGVVFAANEDGRLNLWVSDGTPAGTKRLLEDGCAESCVWGPNILSANGETALFSIDDGVHGVEPWITDGTSKGTRLLADICPGPCSSSPSGDDWKFDDLHYFRAGTLAGDEQLWASDGTSEGTRMIVDLGGSSVNEFVATASGEFYVYLFGSGRNGLWALDASGGFHPVAPAFDEAVSSRPRGGWSTPAATFLLASRYSAAGSGLTVRRWLARTDGTPQGTDWVDGFDVHFEALYSTQLGDRVLVLGTVSSPFPAGLTGALYRSDGTAEGTTLLREGIDLLDPACGFFEVGDSILFLAGFLDPTHLWRTDGTAEGTFRVADRVGPVGCESTTPAVFEDRLYFFSEDGALWRSDGTTGGTEIFFDPPESGRGGEGYMKVAGDYLYFEVVERGGATNLWRTDGSLDGTLRLMTLTDRLRRTDWHFTPLGDLLLFRTAREGVGVELFRTDGSVAGTQLVHDIAPGDLGSFPEHLAVHRGRVFFSAWEPVHGTELWVTDGTSVGTKLVRDIAPGSVSSSPMDLRSVGDALYLAASDGISGLELWQTDGSAAATRRLTDIAPGPYSSSPYVLGSVGDRLLLAADDGSTGDEPWALDPPQLPSSCTTSDTQLCLLDGRFRVQVRWRNQRTGATGDGGALPFSDRSGFFWFFNQANVELVVKVLDGSSINGFYWTFYGALSDVEYTIDVTDLETGASKNYHNPPGEICGEGDTGSIPAGKRSPDDDGAAPFELLDAPLAARAVPLSTSASALQAAACVPSATRLCLLGSRFAVEVDWHNGNTGARGVGGAIQGTNKSGYFWFFNDTNVELVVKMLDGQAINGFYWLFYGALSNVEYTLRVTDTATGAVRSYTNPQGEICGQADTEAFP